MEHILPIGVVGRAGDKIRFLGVTHVHRAPMLGRGAAAHYSRAATNTTARVVPTSFPGMSDSDDLSQAPTRSSRDRGELKVRLAGWLADRLPEGADLFLGDVTSPDGSGMSSETLLFDASWNDDSGRTEHALVARVEPDPADVPVFPTYDLGLQYRVMELVGANSAVPVPTTR